MDQLKKLKKRLDIIIFLLAFQTGLLIVFLYAFICYG